MRTSRFLLALVPAVGVARLVAACTEEPATDIGLVMLSPEGLLDTATSVTLSVFDAAGAQCDAATGSAGTPPKNALSFPLLQDGCEVGKWCGQIKLDKDGANKIFAVSVQNDSGLLGQGCTTAVINQDPLNVSIKVVRFVAPACCGDGALQVGELCDSGGSPSCGGVTADEVCQANCSVAEIPVDRKVGDPAPAVGSGSGLSLAFAGGNGDLANGLRATYELASAAGSDIGVSFLKKDLSHLTTPALLAAPLRIPLRCTSPAGPGQARQQRSPAMVTVDPTTSLVVFTSDEVLPNNFNLFYSSLGANGCADLAPLRVNMVDNGVTNPHVAVGPAGVALIVWEQNGSINGRTYAMASGLGAEFAISQGKTPRVAGSLGSWIVVYEGSGTGDDDGIFAKSVKAGGVVGTETLVNAKTAGVQDQPDVAAQPDGRAIVAFHSDTDVFFQRLDASGALVGGDTASPIHASTDGEQANPAASIGLGDVFVVAWENQLSGEIWARFMGGSSGFVFNNVNGQNSDFLASAAGVSGSRRKPVVTAGGDGYIAMGWEDQSASHAGVFVRRFPIPK